jgi:hypothetical protein
MYIMKMLKALGSGTLRSVKAYKGVIVIWFIYMILVSMLTMQTKGALKTGFGNSMFTEMLKDGINIEVFSDLDARFNSLFSSFSTGLLLVVFVSILVNAFLSGGLFNSLKGSTGNFTVSEFFRSSARYFRSFLGVTVLISLMLIFLGILLIGLPFGIAFGGDSGHNASRFIMIFTGVIIYLIAVIILLLVADYSRARLVTAEKPSCFKALGFGFSTTFRFFLSSFPMMLLLLIILMLFAWSMLRLIGIWNPDTGAGALLLFIVSQILFFCKLLLKAWRYGSVTALMEAHTLRSDKPEDN